MKRRFVAALVFTLSAAVASTGVLSGCAMNQEESGTLIGGAAGAAAGSAMGGGRGRMVAIVLGALLGSQVGANIGRHMDEQDRVRTAEVLEYKPTGQSTTWHNPDQQATYTVTPTRTYDSDAGPCREFTMVADVGGEPQKVYGTACRQPDGSWKIIK